MIAAESKPGFDALAARLAAKARALAEAEAESTLCPGAAMPAAGAAPLCSGPVRERMSRMEIPCAPR